MSLLSKAVEGWDPAPVSVTGVVDPWPGEAFARALDLPTRLAPGDPLPPMWHWFHLLDHPSRSDLGEDGHPAEGAFLPPVPDRRRMFAGARVRWHAPIRIGDEVTRDSSLARVEVKRGRSGEMVFVTVRSRFRRGDEVLLVEDQDVVYRSQPSGGRRPTRGGSPERPTSLAGEVLAGTDEGPPPGTTRVVLDTDPTLLFRVSALTYNTHRIHYDLPYCTDVEGYPGLVVHGPLLALLLMEIPRTAHPDRMVESFAFRLHSPVFSGQRVIADGHAVDGDELVLSASAEGGPTSISASAVFAP
ncbi:FAS1-like dehydratase domain-containing protein [Nocardiopsis prasina]|uniref:FAS1-like dehydratase domain-containing protein n=1 Tax=Nocardiopsis prasina TaxID=2015 RepID=UPI00034CD158|nr:MaoC family dehydratase N-terminal domain-containing protein [Nocardiopsis prasina]